MTYASKPSGPAYNAVIGQTTFMTAIACRRENAMSQAIPIAQAVEVPSEIQAIACQAGVADIANIAQPVESIEG